MHPYIPATEAEKKEMLKAVGLERMDALFADIPENLRLKRPLELGAPRSEMDVSKALSELSLQNTGANAVCFMGGGAYDHYIPAAVSHLAMRSEFFTAYTPYQAEMSQGTLQAIFEYQSMIAALTGMDLSNASVYDGATACAEAINMAHAVNGKKTALLLNTLNPEYAEVCKTYARFRGLNVALVAASELEAALNDDTACVLIQSPNYFGYFENADALASLAREKAPDALVVACCDPISLCVARPPAADIVVGEGQPLGNPMSFGGPGFGFFACRKAYMRKMPGRIVGETADAAGNRGYVLTIQAREQHIRREKATSNICSNQALCALRASIYMTLMGKDGLRKAAELCLHKARYLHDGLISTGMFETVADGVYFKEFTLRYKGSLDALRRRLYDDGYLPGISLSAIPGYENCLLLAVTEKRTREEMDGFIRKAGERI